MTTASPCCRSGTPEIVAHGQRRRHRHRAPTPGDAFRAASSTPQRRPTGTRRRGAGSGDVDIEGRQPAPARRGQLDEPVRLRLPPVQLRGSRSPAICRWRPSLARAPLKPGYVRLYHYTRLGDSERIAKINNEGILLDEASGSQYGEPNMVWASTEHAGPSRLRRVRRARRRSPLGHRQVDAGNDARRTARTPARPSPRSRTPST